jgi:hypothetical protein
MRAQPSLAWRQVTMVGALPVAGWRKLPPAARAGQLGKLRERLDTDRMPMQPGEGLMLPRGCGAVASNHEPITGGFDLRAMSDEIVVVYALTFQPDERRTA